MQMTDGEICGSYREAEDKAKQIKVLAELNATDKATIGKILREGGYKIDGRWLLEKKPAPRKKKAAADAPTDEPPAPVPCRAEDLLYFIQEILPRGAQLLIEGRPLSGIVHTIVPTSKGWTECVDLKGVQL